MIAYKGIRRYNKCNHGSGSDGLIDSFNALTFVFHILLLIVERETYIKI